MQSDYGQFWLPFNQDGQSPDVQFYDFFEDSLNRFISTNSGANVPAGKTNTEQVISSLTGSQDNAAFSSD